MFDYVHCLFLLFISLACFTACAVAIQAVVYAMSLVNGKRQISTFHSSDIY